jgi:PAS domain S-box-containing protein
MEGKGTYINPAFTRVFGWTSGEVLGKKMDYVPDENWPETEAMIGKVQAGEGFSGIESRRYTKEGNILDVSISAAIHLNRDGDPVGSVHILRDITQRKQAEEALQRVHEELERRVEERTSKLAITAQQLKMEISERKRSREQLEQYATELERSNKALEKLAFVASHDLQEPLRTVTTYIRMLQRVCLGKAGSDAEEYIAYAVDGANRMARLIDNLLSYSRVRTGKPGEPTD